MYGRLLKNIIKRKLFKGKAIVITGARQTGKTTLAMDLIHESRYGVNAAIFNCDNPSQQQAKRTLPPEKNIFL